MNRPSFRSRTEYKHWTAISTRWFDNDVYHHVNNTVYYSWMDTAVNGWLLESGLLDLENGNPVGLVVETSCSYASPISFPDHIEVGLRTASIGNSSVTYHLGVFIVGAENASAQGHFIHVYVDRQSRRPVSLPERWRSKVKTLG